MTVAVVAAVLTVSGMGMTVIVRAVVVMRHEPSLSLQRLKGNLGQKPTTVARSSNRGRWSNMGRQLSQVGLLYPRGEDSIMLWETTIATSTKRMHR